MFGMGYRSTPVNIVGVFLKSASIEHKIINNQLISFKVLRPCGAALKTRLLPELS